LALPVLGGPFFYRFYKLLRVQKNPSKFFGQPTTDWAGYKKIRVNIIPEADADEVTLDKWLQILKNAAL